MGHDAAGALGELVLLNLALGLQENGINIIGTSPQSIEMAEDRKLFSIMLTRLDIPQPPNGIATNEAEALEVSKTLGYPVLVRPSFVLGGRAMQIVYSDGELTSYMRHAVEASPKRPVLVDKFLEDATEVDVDCIADVGLHKDPKAATIVIGGMLEHIEYAQASTRGTRRWSCRPTRCRSPSSGRSAITPSPWHASWG